MNHSLLFGTYKMYVGNYDWGCGVDKAVITLNQPVTSIDPSAFSVHVLKMETDMSSPYHPLYESTITRKVTDAYLCDEDGKPVEGASPYIALELYVSPEEGSPLVPTGPAQIFIWSDPYDLQIEYITEEISLSIEPFAEQMITAADVFERKSTFTPEGVYYDYATYSPKEETNTLFVWLHGLGEGQYEGSSAYLPLLGRKGCTMAGEAFQKAIGYAHVLVPQCPTYWMDDDGMQTNLNNCCINATAASYYTESLAAFIDRYAKEIGAKKIVLAGCSNGGFMSLILAMNYPDRYDAIVPICEAVPDASITDEMIEKLVDVPMYFVYSKDDPIVVPELHEIPTIERLKKAGAKDLHVSVTEKVIDTSGKYFMEDGSPYRYMGHLSWIYYDNDETDDGTGLSAWTWLGEKMKG